jgi:hypothetical protein
VDWPVDSLGIAQWAKSIAEYGAPHSGSLRDRRLRTTTEQGQTSRAMEIAAGLNLSIGVSVVSYAKS